MYQRHAEREELVERARTLREELAWVEAALAADRPPGSGRDQAAAPAEDLGLLSERIEDQERVVAELKSSAQALWPSERLCRSSDLEQAAEEREGLLCEVQRQRALLEAIVSQMPGSIVVALPPDARLLYVCDRILGITLGPNPEGAGPISSNPYRSTTLSGEPIAPDDWALMRALRDGESVENRVIKVRHGELERIINTHAQPIRDEAGDIIAAVMSYFDITEQVQAEDELRQHRHHLEELVEERTAAVQRLSYELLQAEQHEREALAVALHDTVGQTLAFACLKAQLAKTRTRERHTEEELGELIALIKQSILEARSLLTQLSPPVAHGASLRQSLEDLGEQMAARYGYTVTTTGPVEPPTLSRHLRVTLYRAARELLINAAKHARASEVAVTLGFTAQSGYLMVSDDGLGFDTCAPIAGSSGGFGLLSIQEHLSQLGGRLQVESEPGRGASIDLIFPLDSVQE